MGVREVIWLAIGLLTIYVAFELYRGVRIGRAGTGAAPAVPAKVDAPAPTPAAGAEAFQMQLELQQLRRELGELRGELADQRRELGELSAGMRAQKEQIEANAAAHGVSPEYDEALVFARRGLGVEAIAERCGITMAEAELVCSLARRSGSDSGAGA